MSERGRPPDSDASGGGASPPSPRSPITRLAARPAARPAGAPALQLHRRAVGAGGTVREFEFRVILTSARNASGAGGCTVATRRAEWNSQQGQLARLRNGALLGGGQGDGAAAAQSAAGAPAVLVGWRGRAASEAEASRIVPTGACRVRRDCNPVDLEGGLNALRPLKSAPPQAAWPMWGAPQPFRWPPIASTALWKRGTREECV